MNAQVKYTYLSRRELCERLAQSGHQISAYLVSRLLRLRRLGRRKMSKTGIAKRVEGRNEQFEQIFRLIAHFQRAGLPVISIDSKKKELLGQLYRPGKVYCEEALVCHDHDFPSLSTGKVVPHGIYDLGLNEGYIHLGTSADTPDFACDCIESWWINYGSKRYPNACEVLVLCDSGGSNNCRFHRFKEALQEVADRTGIVFHVAHYPTHCSKYNPIDHRLFPHVTRALSGVILDSIETVQKLIKERANTTTGLKVYSKIIYKTYQTGIKASEQFINNSSIQFSKILPYWNYIAIPRYQYREVIFC